MISNEKKMRYCHKGTQNMITKTEAEAKRYVWIRADGEAKIIDTDIIELWQGPYFDREKDHIYELGNEVEIKISVNVKNKTAYRGTSYAEGTR